ncbi:MAG: glycosyltransferase family 2 protein [Bryobacterales bacterium]|nr:glycosyltransferase family 2 protein [Bryobacterales bacterium]
MIPAHNEVQNIGPVVRELRALSAGEGGPVFDDVVVCDNRSSDGTARRALSAGARVVLEPTPGYGLACQTALLALWPVDAVVFVDGDQAFEVRQATDLLEVLADGADLVIGSRVLGRCESGAMSAAQVIGNRTASLLIRLLWRHRVSDLGPFRAIRSEALRRLEMCDEAYGWTVEMQIKAIVHGLRVAEVPVDTRRRRHGTSKIGGTLRGVLGASAGILTTIARLRARALPAPKRRRPEDYAAWRHS